MRARIAWLVAALDVVAFVVVSLGPSGGGIETLLYLVGIASFAGVGALLWTRRPANPIGPLLLAAGTLLVVAIVIGAYAEVGAVQSPPWPGAAAARLVGDTLFIYPFLVAFVAVPLVFPDGHLPSPRYRWAVGSLIVFLVTWTFLGLLFGSEVGARIPALVVLEPYIRVLEPVVLLATIVCFGSAISAVASRFRHGGPIQRQQVKWLVADVGLAGTVLPLALLTTDVAPDLANLLSSIAILAMFALPVVIAIAILRYRLYEIDRIVSRTIGWALVTGLLAVVFVGLVVVLQAILAPVTNENTIAVAGSTLVALALFGPLRRRVQRAVDRRFDRARYDGQTTTAAFAERLRNEVDLVTLREQLVATAADAVRPTGAGLWLRTRREA